jgi:hypothetical protein
MTPKSSTVPTVGDCPAPAASGLPAECLLTDEETVQVFADLGINTTEGELAKKRVYGNGPRFYKLGRKVRYTRAIF